MAHRQEERTLGDLFSQLAHDTSTLFRQEVQLAKAELTESASEAGRGIAFLAAGGAVAYAGFLAILAAVILWLWQTGMAGWLAALIVGVIVVVIGAVMVTWARSSLSAERLAPTRTVQTLQEDATWARDQIA